MHELQLLLVTHGLAPPVDRPQRLAGLLSGAVEMEVCEPSIAGADRAIYFLARSAYDKHLGVAYDAASPPPAAEAFEGTVETRELAGVEVAIKLCRRTHGNAAALRRHLPFLQPCCLGLDRSFGLGDRLGLATPGHVRAVRGSGLRPVFAQQSVREMTRTGRTPPDVLDDATWGLLQEGWREPHGADADHLKTLGDVDRCLDAGFTLFTIDPGDHVDDGAAELPPEPLVQAFRNLPWDALESSPDDCIAAYADRPAHVEGDLVVELDEEALMRAAVKYGAAVAHTAMLARHLAERAGERAVELEVSVDETATPTTPQEHYLVARELRRLGVSWVSLAPRFEGRFEKGVDFQGDLGAFERSFAQHAAIARALGPYKLSIHSGSDKFAVYPLAARLAGDLLHVKTAGTSYLEALRTVGRVAPDLLREVLDFACERYEDDRATYHVSASLGQVPRTSHLDDGELESVLDDFHARQVLHVTYGSVLNAEAEGGEPRFRDRLLEALRRNEDSYTRALQRHLGRHIEPLAKG
ncbi:MAG: tagaturonate epimerase family protein [Candidatus Brocadiia bacterium]